MTFILGVKTKDGVFIGSDRQATSMGDHTFDYGNHKLLKVQNYVIGYTASYRTAQIIEFEADKFKPIHSRADVYAFCEQLKQVMIDHGNIERSSDKEELDHEAVTFLLGTTSNLYMIYPNYQFDEVRRKGIGSGGLYGQGYFDGSSEVDTEKRMKEAIKATAASIISVGGKATVWKVE